MILPLKTTLVISQVLSILHPKHTYRFFVNHSIDNKLTGVAGDLMKTN